MAVPYTFGNATTSIPLSQLDTNFATAITIGNTAVYLGNTTTSFGNVTLTNVTISSGNATVTKVTTPTVDSGSGNALTLQSNSTTALYIDTSQNVGIGTASPSYKFQITAPVVNNGISVAQLITNSGTGNAGSAIGLGYNTGNGYYAQLSGVYDGAGSAFTVSTSALTVAATERMRINSSGQVGIGTTSPTVTLQTLGGIAVQAGGNPYPTSGYGWEIYNADASNNYLQSYNRTTSAYLNSVYNALTHQFYISGSEKARIDSSGNLLVGTTTAQATVTVYHAGNQKSADFYAVGNASGTPVMSLRKGVNDATTTNVYVQFLYNNGSTGAGQINGNGGSQAAFGSYSDARLKENIQSLSDQLEKVCSLRPVEFDYKDGNGHQIGFIAQEIQTIYPDVVSVGENEMLTVTGWNKTEARLVQAIKELAAKVDAQAAEIATLKGTK